MLNIYFISNDDRIERLIDHFQPFLKTRIRKASDFDHGLKEVFENRPSAVFIQSDIGSVSGETVARHIKSLLGSDSPRIIFMGGGEAGKSKGDSWCDDWVPMGNSESEFYEGFRKIISSYYPREWTNIAAEIERTARQSADPVSGFDQAETGGVCLPLPGCQDNEQVAADEGIESVDGAVTEESAGYTYDECIPQETPHSVDESVPSLGTFVAHDVSLEAKAGKRGVRVWVIVLIALSVAVAAVYAWRALGNRETSERKPSLSERAAVSAVGTIGAVTGLPSCIRSEWRDADYSAAHPGWERYVSQDYEFRVFRESSAIKALQVLSRAGKGIPGELPLSMLREFGFKGQLPTGVSESREGFVVNRVAIKGIAEFVTYREEGCQTIRAMVLQLS